MVRVYRAAAILLLNTLLLLAAAEGLAAVFLWWSAPSEDPPPHAAARAEQAISDDLDRLTVDYWPYVGWRAHPLTSATLNVDAGGNRVTPGAVCDPGSFTVLVFGGSAVFGYGVPDAGTLPASLQRLLSTRLERPVCVRNLGQFGWSSTQGVIALVRELQAAAAPDLVVFYDGFNDVNLLGEDGVAGGPGRGTPGYDGAVVVARAEWHGARRGLLEFLRDTHLYTVVSRWRRAGPASPDTGPARVSPDGVVRAYLANLESARGIAARHGFRIVFFWQPSLWVKAARTPDEDALLAASAPRPGSPELFRATYPLIAAKAQGTADLFYLGNVFDHIAGASPYLDDCHLTATGNAAVADRVVEALAGAHLLPEA